MGQEQSHVNKIGQTISKTDTSSSTSVSGSVSPTETITTSFSFLARNRNLIKIPQIVTVNEGRLSASDAKEIDEELKNIREIPRFMPILRGILPSQRTLPEVYLKVDPNHILAFMNRMHSHFVDCADIITQEQRNIIICIVEINQFIISLTKNIQAESLRYDNFVAGLKRTAELNKDIEKVQLQFQEVAYGLEALNSALPMKARMPTLANVLDWPPLVGDHRILPAEECIVIDTMPPTKTECGNMYKNANADESGSQLQ